MDDVLNNNRQRYVGRRFASIRGSLSEIHQSMYNPHNYETIDCPSRRLTPVQSPLTCFVCGQAFCNAYIEYRHQTATRACFLWKIADVSGSPGMLGRLPAHQYRQLEAFL